MHIKNASARLDVEPPSEAIRTGHDAVLESPELPAPLLQFLKQRGS